METQMSNFSFLSFRLKYLIRIGKLIFLSNHDRTYQLTSIDRYKGTF